MTNKITYNYFLILFSIIPITMVAGSSVGVTNILLLDLSFIIFLIYKKDYNFLSNKYFKYLLFLYLYLIFNSLISFDKEIGFLRNFGFIRMIILFLAINYFFNQKFFFKKVFLIWLIFFFILLFDVYFEFTFGKNIFGFEGPGGRIVSFFQDEAIVAGFINAFFLIIIGFLLNEYEMKHRYKILLFALIFLIIIGLTGERSNTIKAFLGFFLFCIFLKDFKVKTKILATILIFILSILAISNSSYLQKRFYYQFKIELFGSKLGLHNPHETRHYRFNYSHLKKNLSKNIYIKLQKSGLEVFKQNKFFGVGNKNYRLITCDGVDKPNINFFCSTHPHQVYVEFLSEHGLLGSLILMLLFYKLIFSKIKYVLSSRNYIQIGSLCYLIFSFTPLIPGGAFFSGYTLTLFMINLSIFFGSDDKLNIFSNDNKQV